MMDSVLSMFCGVISGGSSDVRKVLDGEGLVEMVLVVWVAMVGGMECKGKL